MTGPEVYETTPHRVRALQFRLGETTRGEILSFCPAANIGVPLGSDEEMAASTDIRWAAIPRGVVTGHVIGGDIELSPDWWLLEDNGVFWTMSPDRFERSYRRPQ